MALAPASPTRPAVASEEEVHECSICLENILPTATLAQEKRTQLDCSHIFHKECIGAWVNRQHNCPLCRAVVAQLPGESENSTTAPSAEVAVTIPESPVEPKHLAEILSQIRAEIRQIRSIRRVSLNEDTPLGEQTRRVHNVAAAIFGLGR
jgi:hypothetical protein